MPRTVQFTDEFLSLEVAKLYQLGVVGPRYDRARRHTGPSAVYQVTWQLGTECSALSAQLEGGALTVTGTMLESTEWVRLGSYSQGLFGGARLVFHCPSCDRRCFSLYAPSPASLIRPDGSANQRRLLCKHCHNLRTPSWRFDGHDEKRAAHQRRTLREKLGDQPADRQPGVSRTRHQRRFARLLRAERLILTPPFELV